MDATADNLTHTAHRLHDLYQELEHAKSGHNTTIKERPMNTKGRLGPSAPLPIWTLSDDQYFTELLHGYCIQAANHTPLPENIRTHGFTHDGRRLTTWIANNADHIAELPIAETILDEMRSQARELNHKLRRTRTPTPQTIIDQSKHQRFINAATAAGILTELTGHRYNRNHITKWAERGQIPYHLDDDGKRCYLIGEILNHLHT